MLGSSKKPKLEKEFNKVTFKATKDCLKGILMFQQFQVNQIIVEVKPVYAYLSKRDA